MSESPSPPSGGIKWYQFSFFVSLFAFALLWSLGSFFVWVTLGGVVFSCIIWMTRSNWAFKMQESIRSSRRTFTPPQRPKTATTQTAPVSSQSPAKAIKATIIVMGAIVGFIMMVGFFASLGDDSDENSESITLEQPIEAEPVSPTADLEQKGQIALERQDYDSAMYYYQEAVRVNPESADNLYNLALCYEGKKDFFRSNTLARRCLRRKPDYNAAHWVLGWNYNEMGYYDSAMISVNRGLENGFSDPGFIELAAELHQRMGKREKSISLYKQLLNIDSSRAVAYTALAELDPANASTYSRLARKHQ